MDKASLLKSPPVTVEPWQATMWHRLIGNLVGPFKGVSFRQCEVGLVKMFVILSKLF
jgi:hypothetical protein